MKAVSVPSRNKTLPTKVFTGGVMEEKLEPAWLAWLGEKEGMGTRWNGRVSVQNSVEASRTLDSQSVADRE